MKFPLFFFNWWTLKIASDLHEKCLPEIRKLKSVRTGSHGAWNELFSGIFSTCFGGCYRALLKYKYQPFTQKSFRPCDRNSLYVSKKSIFWYFCVFFHCGSICQRIIFVHGRAINNNFFGEARIEPNL